MKNLFTRFAFAVALGGLMISNSPVFAQGTAFTYQGRLDNGTNLANGNYDLTFSLFNASVSGSQIGSTITNLDVVVSNGLFTTSADFGPVFNGTAYWLQIGVRSNGGSSFTLLTPLQELTPTPYSITAENVSGVIPLSQLPATVALISDPGSTGSKNFFAGQEAGNASLSGAANTGVGYEALFGNASGNYNTALGVSALAHDYTGGYNTALGAAALEWNNTGSYNTATGYNAMANIPSYVTGDYNTANGAWALTDDDSGSNNSAIGVQALYQNTTGNGNIALGYQAGYDNLSGNDNIDIGNVGSSSDNGVMRLGTPGLQSKTIIAGTAVGLNTSTPSQALEVNGNFVEIDGANAYNGAGPINAYIGGNGSGSDVQIGSLNSNIANVAFYNWGNSTYMHIFCSQITVEGGSDLAEPFEVSSANRDIPQGSVVVIDDVNPGRLKVSDQPYDTRVAGVLSGANGINPGIQMQQQGLLEGGKNVALTGRVYVLADASSGPIKPGDLLTTSSTPGHAMKVTDHARASGAILGKAMSGLKQGRGMVLVLVTLQ